MFLLSAGTYRTSKQEYAYGRRAQSVTKTLHWTQIGTLDVSDLDESVNLFTAFIREHRLHGEKFMVEGIGPHAGIVAYLDQEGEPCNYPS